MAAPFALTYTAAAAELPAWQSYTESATLTTTAGFTYATLDAQGVVTFVSGEVVQTQYGTEIVQLPITVDVGYSVGAPYTTAGGDGPTVVSVLGASAAITLPEASQMLPGATAAGSDASSAETTAEVTSADPSSSAGISPTASGTSPSAAASSTSPPSDITASASSPIPSASSGLSTLSASSTGDSSTSSAPASTLSSFAPGSSTLPSSSASPSTAAASSNSSNLSGGQIAGIVVGCLAALLLLLLLLLCALRRRRLQRDASGASHEWDLAPAANSTWNSRRRSSAGTGGSRGGLWGLAGLVGISSTTTGSPSTGGDRRGSGMDEKEKGMVGGMGAVREAREDGEGFEGMAMMDERASPRSIFPTVRGRGTEYAAVGAAGAGAVAAAGMARSRSGGSGERGELLGDPFEEPGEGERDEADIAGEEEDVFGDQQQGLRTPDMRGGDWAGAAAATGLLHNVEGDWTGTPSTHAGPSPGRRSPKVYPSFRISGTSDVDSLPPRPPRRTTGPPMLSEFAWMRGRPGVLGDTASTNTSGNTGTQSSGSGTGTGSRSGGSGVGTGSSGFAAGDSRGSRGTSSMNASPNVSELFHNTPRWLGTRRPSADDVRSPSSFYPEDPDDSPLLYPLATTNSDPMRQHLRQSAGSASTTPASRPLRHSSSAGMLDRIAASFGMALSGLGIRQGRSRETSHDSESAGSHDRYTATPPRLAPRLVSQASHTATPEHAPLRRSITTATFGQPLTGLLAPPSPTSSEGAQVRSFEGHDSFEQDFTPPKHARAAGRDNRLTSTSFGTLGQPIDGIRSPSPSEVLSDADLGATTLGSHSLHSGSGSGSGGGDHHRRFSSSEASGSHETSNGSHSHRGGSGSGGGISAGETGLSPPLSPAYDRRRNTLGRQITASEAGSGSGSGASRSRSTRTGEGSGESVSGASSSAHHSSGRSASEGMPPTIPESETVRQLAPSAMA